MNCHNDSDQTYKILLVEDDPVDAELVRRHLAQSLRPRFKVENVQFLRDAVRLLESETFDTVLLDLNLPDSDGLESIGVLKSIWRAGPIIVLTGLDDDCLGIDAVRHGVQDYLSKDGLSANLLSRSICYAIERHRMSYWIKATGQSKDAHLSSLCDTLRDTLSRLLNATSVLVGQRESLKNEDLEQIETIMACGAQMSELIDQASPKPVIAEAV